VSTDKVSSSNWIGIWPDPGDGPVDGTYVGSQITYRYAPGASGTVAISSGMLKAGGYLAFYLYDDGYTSLAEPVGFTVHDTPQLPPPRYAGDFGGEHRHPMRTPAGMTVDRTGRFWVADTRGQRVHVFTRRGRHLGSLGAGVLREPQDVAVSGHRVYVADAMRDRVDEFDLRGRHLGSLGVGEVDRPRGVEVDRRGRVLVADVGNNRVARFDAGSRRLVGEITTDVHIPFGMVVDGDSVWVVSSSRQFDGNPGITRYVDDQPTITLGYGPIRR
jgi:DNA-binding beta-propeller fold protein YncE